MASVTLDGEHTLVVERSTDEETCFGVRKKAPIVRCPVVSPISPAEEDSALWQKKFTIISNAIGLLVYLSSEGASIPGGGRSRRRYELLGSADKPPVFRTGSDAMLTRSVAALRR